MKYDVIVVGAGSAGAFLRLLFLKTRRFLFYSSKQGLTTPILKNCQLISKTVGELGRTLWLEENTTGI